MTLSVHLCVQHVGRDAERRAVSLRQPRLVSLRLAHVLAASYVSTDDEGGDDVGDDKINRSLLGAAMIYYRNRPATDSVSSVGSRCGPLHSNAVVTVISRTVKSIQPLLGYTKSPSYAGLV